MGYRSFLTIQVTLYDHALPKSLKTKKNTRFIGHTAITGASQVA